MYVFNPAFRRNGCTSSFLIVLMQLIIQLLGSHIHTFRLLGLDLNKF